MAFVNEAQKQGELLISGKAEVRTPQIKGGFDLVVGNPPFVTARNPIKRELYRERWPRVCHKNYLLVCPFFDLSFGLLRKHGQLGFIVSNAFAKRDFGKPLIESFFPSVRLQKIIDCSGLMFPGHGTPTCIVFGEPQRSPKDSRLLVSATRPGGGDLRTPPEHSALWQALAREHENPGYEDARISVSSIGHTEAERWPWQFLSDRSPSQESGQFLVNDVAAEPIGAQFITGKDDAFVVSGHYVRRCKITPDYIKPYVAGEDVRNWTYVSSDFIIFPYDLKLAPLKEPLPPGLRCHLKPHKEVLENSVISGSIKKRETKLKWFEFRRLARAKFEIPVNLLNPHIATHCHFLVADHTAAFKEKALAIALKPEFLERSYLLAGFLNSSSALFWLKQVCFSKRESEEGARDTYFEFAGGKVEQLPLPKTIAAGLRGESVSLTDRLETLAERCSEFGSQLAALALRKLFENSGEAYHTWDALLPGYVAPAPECLSFVSSASLRQVLKSVIVERERRRSEMIGLQEEMDWLCYEAYGLIPENSQSKNKNLNLSENERPFRLWTKARGDFDDAIALIPEDWSADRKKLWQLRLAVLRDNEHIRRVEASVYKRRWDEQWKVGNRWVAGHVAYAQEFIDAFTWWLAERAEWHLEHKSGGSPVALEAWTAALWKDARVAAAWPVVAESLNAVETWKASAKDKKLGQPIATDHSSFAKFFRETVDAETVPSGIPAGTSWEDLEKKGIKANAQAKKVRGKLNVPRERFRRKKDGTYTWAGKQ